MDDYVAAKANILRYQEAGNWAVLNADDPIASGLRNLCVGRLLEFSLAGPVAQGAYLEGDNLIWAPEPGERFRVCSASELRLRGRHNVANVLAACAISGAAGATSAAMAAVATSFAGVEHRLELVRERDGVGYYNDSIATSPERAIAALRSFREPIVLLAGGRDKHLPWEDWAALVRERVRELICFGEMAPLLQRALAEAVGGDPDQDGPPVHICETMEEAVALASRVARPGDVALSREAQALMPCQNMPRAPGVPAGCSVALSIRATTVR